MHYKNGREAQENNPVVGMTPSGAIAGTVYNITTAGYCVVAVPTPGGVEKYEVKVEELFHAQDAVEAASTAMLPPQV